MITYDKDGGGIMLPPFFVTFSQEIIEWESDTTVDFPIEFPEVIEEDDDDEEFEIEIDYD